MDIFQGTVAKLAFGGDGVLRADGLVIFVPFTAPGDQIEGQITTQKKRYAHGEVLKVLNASQERTEPRCPYFGICGGCQLQHMLYEAQIEAKREMVAEAFERIGKVSELSILPTHPSPSPWTYRRHVTLHLREMEGVFQVGYYALDNQTLLPVQQCPIFIAPENEIFKQLYPLIALLKPKKGDTGRAILLKKEEGGYLLALQLQHRLDGVDTLLKNSPFAGTLIKTGPKIEGVGAVELFYSYEGLHFEFSPFAFIQNHPDQSRWIYEQIIQMVDQGPVVDLYCGVGVTSLLLAQKGLEVLGIESNPKAIELARKNSERLKVRAEFICADAGSAFKKVLAEKQPAWVVVNPPREGLDKKVIEALCQAKVKGLIYVSCMPSTIARDTQLLGEAGYRVELCQPVDMFPQTGHIETLAVYRNEKNN